MELSSGAESTIAKIVEQQSGASYTEKKQTTSAIISMIEKGQFDATSFSKARLINPTVDAVLRSDQISDSVKAALAYTVDANKGVIDTISEAPQASSFRLQNFSVPESPTSDFTSGNRFFEKSSFVTVISILSELAERKTEIAEAYDLFTKDSHFRLYEASKALAFLENELAFKEIDEIYKTTEGSLIQAIMAGVSLLMMFTPGALKKLKQDFKTAKSGLGTQVQGGGAKTAASPPSTSSSTAAPAKPAAPKAEVDVDGAPAPTTTGKATTTTSATQTAPNAGKKPVDAETSNPTAVETKKAPPAAESDLSITPDKVDAPAAEMKQAPGKETGAAPAVEIEVSTPQQVESRPLEAKVQEAKPQVQREIDTPQAKKELAFEVETSAPEVKASQELDAPQASTSRSETIEVKNAEIDSAAPQAKKAMDKELDTPEAQRNSEVAVEPSSTSSVEKTSASDTAQVKQEFEIEAGPTAPETKKTVQVQEEVDTKASVTDPEVATPTTSEQPKVIDAEVTVTPKVGQEIEPQVTQQPQSDVDVQVQETRVQAQEKIETGTAANTTTDKVSAEQAARSPAALSRGKKKKPSYMDHTVSSAGHSRREVALESVSSQPLQQRALAKKSQSAPNSPVAARSPMKGKQSQSAPTSPRGDEATAQPLHGPKRSRSKSSANVTPTQKQEGRSAQQVPQQPEGTVHHTTNQQQPLSSSSNNQPNRVDSSGQPAATNQASSNNQVPSSSTNRATGPQTLESGGGQRVSTGVDSSSTGTVSSNGTANQTVTGVREPQVSTQPQSVVNNPQITTNQPTTSTGGQAAIVESAPTAPTSAPQRIDASSSSPTVSTNRDATPLQANESRSLQGANKEQVSNTTETSTTGTSATTSPNVASTNNTTNTSSTTIEKGTTVSASETTKTPTSIDASANNTQPPLSPLRSQSDPSVHVATKTETRAVNGPHQTSHSGFEGQNLRQRSSNQQVPENTPQATSRDLSSSVERNLASQPPHASNDTITSAPIAAEHRSAPVDGPDTPSPALSTPSVGSDHGATVAPRSEPPQTISSTNNPPRSVSDPAQPSLSPLRSETIEAPITTSTSSEAKAVSGASTNDTGFSEQNTGKSTQSIPQESLEVQSSSGPVTRQAPSETGNRSDTNRGDTIAQAPERIEITPQTAQGPQTSNQPRVEGKAQVDTEVGKTTIPPKEGALGTRDNPSTSVIVEKETSVAPPPKQGAETTMVGAPKKGVSVEEGGLGGTTAKEPAKSIVASNAEKKADSTSRVESIEAETDPISTTSLEASATPKGSTIEKGASTDPVAAELTIEPDATKAQAAPTSREVQEDLSSSEHTEATAKENPVLASANPEAQKRVAEEGQPKDPVDSTPSQTNPTRIEGETTARIAPVDGGDASSFIEPDPPPAGGLERQNASSRLDQPLQRQNASSRLDTGEAPLDGAGREGAAPQRELSPLENRLLRVSEQLDSVVKQASNIDLSPMAPMLNEVGGHTNRLIAAKSRMERAEAEKQLMQSLEMTKSYKSLLEQEVQNYQAESKNVMKEFTNIIETITAASQNATRDAARTTGSYRM